MGQQYALEFKESIVKRMLSPQNEYIPTLSRETGIPVDTLYIWRVKYRSRFMGAALLKDRETSSLSSEEKLSILLETMSLNEHELGEYCRQKGLYPEQIEAWKKTVLEGLGSLPEKTQREKVSQQAKTIRQLESELLRKEKSLAEAATLLMLKKKWTLFWRKKRSEDRWGVPSGNDTFDRGSPKGGGSPFQDLCRSGDFSQDVPATWEEESGRRGRAQGSPDETSPCQWAHLRRGGHDCINGERTSLRLHVSGPDRSDSGR